MVQSNVCPLRMAPPGKNPMKAHMQRRSWSTDRLHTHTLSRLCDLCHGHGKTTQSGPSTRHNCPEQQTQKRKQIHANTRAHQKTSSATQTNCTLSYVSQRITTSANLARRSIPVVLHNVATHIDKDHQRQHVMGTAQDADKEAYVRGCKALRQNTRRTDASEHHLSASSPKRTTKTTQKVFPSNSVQTQNETHKAHDTATNKPNFTSPYGV